MPFDFSGEDVMGWFLRSLPYISTILFAGYLIVGGVLDYHWRHYGVGIVKIFQLRLAYIVIGIVLFGVLLTALFSL